MKGNRCIISGTLLFYWKWIGKERWTAADGFLNSSLTIWLKTVPSIQERISKERTPPKTNYVTSLEQAFIGGSFLFVQFQDVFQDDYRLFLHVQAFTSRIFPQNPEPHLSWTISCLSFIGLWLIRGNVGSCSPWASVPLKRLWFAAHRSTFHLPHMILGLVFPCVSFFLERFFHEENYFSWIDSCNLSRKKNKHTVNPERARERERESNQGP